MRKWKCPNCKHVFESGKKPMRSVECPGCSKVLHLSRLSFPYKPKFGKLTMAKPVDDVPDAVSDALGLNEPAAPPVSATAPPDFSNAETLHNQPLPKRTPQRRIGLPLPVEDERTLEEDLALHRGRYSSLGTISGLMLVSGILCFLFGVLVSFWVFVESSTAGPVSLLWAGLVFLFFALCSMALFACSSLLTMAVDAKVDQRERLLRSRGDVSRG